MEESLHHFLHPISLLSTFLNQNTFCISFGYFFKKSFGYFYLPYSSANLFCNFHDIQDIIKHNFFSMHCVPFIVTAVTGKPCLYVSYVLHLMEKPQIIEGFGGKRVVGILRKIELCQKRSKFRMQFCLGILNNVLHVFSLKLVSFLRYYVCEKTHFSEGIL